MLLWNTLATALIPFLAQVIWPDLAPLTMLFLTITSDYTQLSAIICSDYSLVVVSRYGHHFQNVLGITIRNIN